MSRTYKPQISTSYHDDDKTEPLALGAKSQKPKPQRKLSQMIMSRWYRPPEVLLLEKYSEKIDIWSVGCIFAELLYYSMDYREAIPNKSKRYLFKGGSCFMMSPGAAQEEKEEGVIVLEDND